MYQYKKQNVCRKMIPQDNLHKPRNTFHIMKRENLCKERFKHPKRMKSGSPLKSDVYVCNKSKKDQC